MLEKLPCAPFVPQKMEMESEMESLKQSVAAAERKTAEVGWWRCACREESAGATLPLWSIVYRTDAGHLRAVFGPH